jgi:hypothetical protein
VDFNDMRLLDQIAYDLILGDYPRGQNRAKIAEIANGVPPFTEQQVEDNNIEVNFNDLTMTRRLHDARVQMANGLMKTGNYFTVKANRGPKHKRDQWSTIRTQLIGRRMKRSISYYEAMRSKIGLVCLHGISPAAWETEDAWCTRPMGVEDVLIPSNTLLGFSNLPFFVLRRSFTGNELQKLTRGKKTSSGWNMPLVTKIIKWVDEQTTQLRSTNWPEVWAPEKVSERVKQDGGYYLGDQAPTVDCFDIYGYSESEKESGWVRRIILDSWGTPSMVGGAATVSRKSDAIYKNSTKDDFLFSSKERKVGQDWRNILSFQFADLSSVAPFRYHSVRSLGFLLYGICHMQNRMRCKFMESVLEALMPYFEVDSMDDAQRALKLDLVNRGFIDKTMRPVKAADRWQVNEGLVELGMNQNQMLIGDSSGAFAQNRNQTGSDTEKTRFQYMAELQANTAMVGGAMAQAYQYQYFEFEEINRRFCKKNSRDVDVQIVQAESIRQGIPSEMCYSPDAWDVTVERIMGGGNQTMEMQIAGQLMQWIDRLDPDPQRKVLRKSVLAITGDASIADDLVPEEKVMSSSVHDAQLAASGLLLGLPQTLKEGVNHQEYAAELLKSMASQVQKIAKAQNGVATQDQLNGLQDIAGQTIQGQPIQGNGAMAHIALLEKNEGSKQVAKQLGDALGKLMNELKAFAQRMQEQAKAQAKAAQQQNGGPDPKDAAKIQGMQAQAQTKVQIARESAGQRTAQRQIQFQQKIRQDAEKHNLELAKTKREHAANIEKTDLEAAANIRRTGLQSTNGGDE